jgi:hypothetical protein
VDNQNKFEFIIQCAKQRMLGNGSDVYLNNIVKNFNSIIPAHLLSDLTPEEVELLICGQPVIDVDDWKQNTMYTGGFIRDSEVVKWFWEIIDDMLEVCYY